VSCFDVPTNYGYYYNNTEGDYYRYMCSILSGHPDKIVGFYTSAGKTY